MNYNRHLDQEIKNHFFSYKEALILLGPRQVGKTMLLKRLFPDATYLLADDKFIKQALENYSLTAYKALISDFEKPIIIDEIQRLSDPGLAAKLLYDQIPGIKLIITGSSALNIKNKMTDSLAGRAMDYQLFPLTFSEYLHQQELEKQLNYHIFNQLFASKQYQANPIFLFEPQYYLEQILLFGSYPLVLNSVMREELLISLVDKIILKDIIDLKLIEQRELALNLLKLLAYQIGQLINYHELSLKLGADIKTVKKYIRIFEQSYLIFRLFPFSQNHRSEITKAPKIYFYDTGLRNALINNFESLQIRPDRGQLFENFIITEIIKSNQYLRKHLDLYYWRKKNGSEVDLVLSKHQQLTGIELKYHNGAVNRAFVNRYPQAKLQTITSVNFYSSPILKS